jgi:hypothetical protein
MTNRKFPVLFALAIAALPTAAERVASANPGKATMAEILSPDTNRLAPTNTDGRLRRTKDFETNEMAHLTMFADNKSGLYFEMRSSELNGVRPVHRMQCAMVPFALGQDAEGSVTATPDLTKARFVTANQNTNEYRNCNFPQSFAVNANTICMRYNIQMNNTNNTEEYLQCYNKAGDTILPQTKIYAKNNDDVCGGQSDQSSAIIKSSGSTFYVAQACLGNGNGDDAAWLFTYTLTLDNPDAPTKATFAKGGDVIIEQEEERTRPMCHLVAGDVNTAYCSLNAGNNQNPRNGNKLVAVDLTNPNRPSILWSKTVQNRKAIDIGNGQTVNTRAVRAQSQMIKQINATTGALENSNLMVYQSLDLKQNTNNNGTKGSREIQNNLAVLQVSRDGYTEVMPFTNMAEKQLLGFDGTHNTMIPAFFGTSDAPTPGIALVSGDHLGGAISANFHMLGYDMASKTFVDHGNHSGAPYDRHLYSNYLGNNPGEQGRNYSGGDLIANPFYGISGNKDKYLIMFATTGKSMANVANMGLQPSSWITVMPVVSDADAAQDPQDPNPPQQGSGSGSGSGTGTGDDGSSATLGGCSTGGAAGLSSLVLVGLAAFRRRRR